MTNFNFTIGAAASATKLPRLAASKYSVSPRSAPFDVQVDGEKSVAWTTKGNGSHYVYFKQGDQLYYVKMASEDELATARQGLAIESEEFAAKFQADKPTPKPGQRRAAKAK